MLTRHIATKDWRDTLDRLSTALDGAIVSLEVVGSEVGAEEEVHEQPFHGIDFDRSGVTMHVGNIPGLHLDHHVAEPRSLRVVETEEGAIVAIEVGDTQGQYTLLRLRSPIRPELLDDAVE